MITADELYSDPCSKLDSWCVDAYFDLKLEDYDPTKLTLDTSWGEQTIDLTPAIKAGETITHLLLTDTALQFNREDYGRDGAENEGIDCISGDALSRIISMQLLKDVAQPPMLSDGDVYMYDGTTKLFYVFNLQDYINNTNTLINNLQQRLTTAEATINSFGNRITNLEQVTARPGYVPSNAVLAWGNINNSRNSAPAAQGIWTHNPNTLVEGDERFD